MNARILLDALRFSEPDQAGLRALDEGGWRELVSFADRSHLTLLLPARCGDALPPWVRDRIAQNLAANAQRLERIRACYAEIASALEALRIPHVVLKGLAQSPDYVADPVERVQYDVDLFCPGDPIWRARDTLLALRYEPLREFEEFPTDHLPTMVRKTGYLWQGDYFDPEIPIAVDLHFRLWDEATEGFPAPGVEIFWERRDGPRLAPADQLGYTALHLLRHLLRSSLRPYHVYELAYFLHTHAGSSAFWEDWRASHPDGLRRLEALCFRLAREWFRCHLSPAAQAEVDRLPEEIARWFEHYSFAPLAAHPHKNELWLHLCLLGSARVKARVLRRRLLPARMPGPVDAVFVPEEQLTWRLRVRRAVKYTVFVTQRVWFHARALLPTIAHGLLWHWRRAGLRRDFWIFLGAAALFTFGIFLFFLLYNLHLIDLGYGENVMGLVAGAMTAGSLAGALPAAWLLRRQGLKRGLVLCFVATAATFTIRAVVTGKALLAGSAFLGGAVLSIWQVATAPAVATLVPADMRPRAFSLFLSSAIGVGVVAGVLGGFLASLWSKPATLLAGCALAGAAVWPLARLRLAETSPTEPRTYPWNAFLARYLPVLAAWSLAVGAFNPLFNAYFARLGTAVEKIGLIFSAGQLTQVAAILAAPLVFRRLGMIAGIAGMQLATAVSLALLATGPAGLAAAVLYAAYTGFQYMSEPGMFSLLMDRVPSGQRSGASALNFFVIHGSQALAAAAAGTAVAASGYEPVLGAAAALAALAGLWFWLALRR